MFPIRRFVVAVAISLILLMLFIVNRSWAQAVLGLVIALVLPGYTITQAFLPRQLDIPTRIVLSIGVSLAVDALGGLLLNLTPWGLQLVTWSLLLLGISVLFAVIAFLRRTWESPLTLIFGVRTHEGLLFGAAIVIALVALTIATSPAPPQSIEGYTSLWVAPLDSPDQSTIRYGVKSLEVTVLEYSLKIKVDDQVISQSPIISLNPGDEWEGELAIPPSQTASTRIGVDLYRLDNPQAVYRQVILNRK